MSIYFAVDPGKLEIVTWYADNAICLQEVRFSVPISEWNKFLNSKLCRELERYIGGLKIQDTHTGSHEPEYTKETEELKQSQKNQDYHESFWVRVRRWFHRRKRT